MPTLRSCVLLAAALTTAIANAQQDDNEATTAKLSWRESVIARCAEQYSAAQCQDEQFLEENFHLESLETAHRTAARRNQLEKAALRELTLQRICDKSASGNCAGASDPAQCAVEITQSCQALATQTASCQQNAKLVCATDTTTSNCIKVQSANCPSVKKQSLPDFLAKYPSLTSAQIHHLTYASKQLDAAQGSWFSDLLNWLDL